MSNTTTVSLCVLTGMWFFFGSVICNANFYILESFRNLQRIRSHRGCKIPLGLVRAVSPNRSYLLFFPVFMSKIPLSEMGRYCYPVEILTNYVLKTFGSEASDFDPFAPAKDRGSYSNGWRLKLVPMYSFLQTTTNPRAHQKWIKNTGNRIKPPFYTAFQTILWISSIQERYLHF